MVISTAKGNRYRWPILSSLIYVMLALACLSGYPFFEGRVHLHFLILLALMVLTPLLIPFRDWLTLAKPKLADAGLFVLLLVACISAALQPNSKAVFYMASYVIAFFGMAYFVRNLMEGVCQRDLALTVNLYAVLVVALIAIVEFSVELIGFDLSETLYNMGLRNTRGNSLYSIPPGIYVARTYSLAQEPTYLGMYYNMLGIVAIGTTWLRDTFSRSKRIIFSLIIFAAYCMTFSAVTFTAAFLAALLTLALGLILVKFNIGRPGGSNARIKKILVSSCLAIAMFFGILTSAEYLIGFRTAYDGSSAIIRKLGFKTTSDEELKEAKKLESLVSRSKKPDRESMEIKKPDAESTKAKDTGDETTEVKIPVEKITKLRRIDVWKHDISLTINKPLLGYGPGYISSTNRSSSLNTYIFVAVESGVIALFGLIFFFAMTWRDMVISRDNYAPLFQTGMVAGTIHMMTHSQYYYASFWMFIGLFYLVRTTTPGKDDPARFATGDSQSINVA